MAKSKILRNSRRELQRSLKKNPNVHSKLKKGKKVLLLIDDTYRFGYIKDIRYAKNIMYFKVVTKILHCAVEKEVTIELDHTQVMEWIPKWKWQLKKFFSFIHIA